MSVADEGPLLPTNNELKQCRICLDSDNLDDMISPCLCSGGSLYVHRKCLNNWRSENANGRTFKFCEICQFEYILEAVLNDPEAEKQRLIKYYLFVIRDLILLILLSQLIIVGVAFLLNTIDRNGENIKHLFPESINGLVAYYVSAFILLMAILGFFTLIFFCCMYIYSGGTTTSQRRSTSSNYSSSNRTSANGFFIIVVTMVVICAVIGVFVGIILSIIILRKILKHHTNKLWLRQEAEKYIVKDFTGRRKELEKYKNTYHTTTGHTDN